MLAVVLTAKVLGMELGVARAVGAVSFALVIGGIMHWIYRHEEAARALTQKGFAPGAGQGRSLGETAAFFALQIAVLVFANWAPASAEDSAVWHAAVRLEVAAHRPGRPRPGRAPDRPLALALAAAGRHRRAGRPAGRCSSPSTRSWPSPPVCSA